MESDVLALRITTGLHQGGVIRLDTADHSESHHRSGRIPTRGEVRFLHLYAVVNHGRLSSNDLFQRPRRVLGGTYKFRCK